MDISKRIIVIFVSVSLIPILFISALSAFSIYNVSNDNAEDSAIALRSEELANLGRMSNDTALFIEERMQNYIDGVLMMEKYCEDLFNNRLNASPQHSYWWDYQEEFDATGELVPGRHYEADYDSSDISFDVSCYYMPREHYDTPGDPFTRTAETNYFIDMSSNMDNVFRSLHEMNSDYIWLYMGFNPTICDSHLFRNYPYDNLEYFWDWYDNGNDYDPVLEDWYINAVAASDGEVAFTSPYGDPSTGLVISMGRPVHFDNGTLIGVVSADVTLDTVLASVVDIDVLDSGYAYLLNSDGSPLAHPDITNAEQSIYKLEFGSVTSSEATAFANILADTQTQTDGQTDFTKNGETWILTYNRIPNTGFLLAVVVPSNEVVAPANAILNLVLGQTTILILILGGILALVAGSVTYVSYRRANAVVEPIGEMTSLVRKMSRQDFTRGITAKGAMFEEVGTTVDALLSFQEACRFGNQAFVRGDLNRALANYQNLLEISKRLDIPVGEQTMCLNIGNVFRQRGDTDNAMEFYQRALTIAKELLEKAKADGADERDAMVRIGSVYHNMALVEMDRTNYTEALRYLEDAEAIDRSLSNDRGLAKRFDAMGLVMMRQQRYSQAQSKFEEAEEMAKRSGYDRSLAYISFHKGELNVQQGFYQKAEESFKNAIDYGKDVEEYGLVVHALQELAGVLDRLGKPSHELRREAERVRRSMQFKKSVILVIDYSGSMQAQGRIKAAIAGAKEILDSQVNPQDEVSIIVFNNTYKEVLPLTKKGNYQNPDDSPIIQALDSLKYPNYATAFYDALGKALQELDKVESSEHRWIIALTDGQDNSSKIFSLDALEGITEKDRYKKNRPLTIEGYIRDNHLDVNLIIIGVGGELKSYVDKDVSFTKTGKITFEQLLMSVCDNIPQGQYLSVTDSIDVHLDIQKAFQQVGVLMAQLEVGGSTTDY
ncbi:MAG: tetratricopeptide repeat protein [Candidatus Lokiarchaeota archaeon]|nr:tetratricopeptide repeat protein [Candidatus Lokiarchaeota archaeon]